MDYALTSWRADCCVRLHEGRILTRALHALAFDLLTRLFGSLGTLRAAAPCHPFPPFVVAQRHLTCASVGGIDVPECLCLVLSKVVRH